MARKPPPDDEVNLRGRLVGLRSRLRRNARATSETEAGYRRALTTLTRDAGPLFRDLERRLAEVRGRPNKRSEGADILETLSGL